jgi:homoserine O-acetyltransferase
MIQATELVRAHLGVEKVDLLIGSSIGGFQALEWAVSAPDLFQKAIFIATAPRISPWLAASAEAQRMALDADPTFRAAQSLQGGTEGLKCARAQAIISYRCFEGFQHTQFEQDEDCLFSGRAASYERYQGEKIIRRGFDAYSYWYLCQALHSHNLGRGRGGVAKALGSIQAASTVVTIHTDNIFPPQEMDSWAPLIPGVDYHHIPSLFGHDGFLLETAALTAIIEPLLCK